MIHHVVLLRFAEGIEPERVAEFTAALRALPAAIPEMRTSAVGTGMHEDNWDFGIAASFDTVEDWKVYDTHPAHNAARTIVAGHFVDRSAAQFAD